MDLLVAGGSVIELESMADTDICIPPLENGSTGENGGHEQLPIQWDEGMSLEGVNGTIKNSSDIEESIENFEGLLQLNGNSVGQGADTSMLSDQSNSLAASKVAMQLVIYFL